MPETQEAGLPSSVPSGVEAWATDYTSRPPSEPPNTSKPVVSSSNTQPVYNPKTSKFDQVTRPATPASGQPQPLLPTQPPAENTNVTKIPPVTHGSVVNWFTTNTPMPQHVAEAFADEVNRESGFHPDQITQDSGGPSGGLFQMHLDRLQRLQQNPNWRNPEVQYQNAWADFNGGDTIATQHRDEIMRAGSREEARLLLRKYFFRPAGTSLNDTTVGNLPSYQPTMEQKQKLYDQGHAGLQQILEEMRKEPVGSAERHKMLQQSLDKSAALQDQYKSLLQTPPQHKPTDLLSAFGSLAMLAAAIGGRRSMQPATASLNAAAGVIEGINSNNDQQYDRAFKQWGAQSKMLENVIGMQSDDFKMIMEDQKLSEKERHDKIEEMAQIWNMQHVTDAMRSGDLDKAFKYIEELPKLKLELEEKRARIDEMHATTEERKAHAKYYEQGGNRAKAAEYEIKMPDGTTQHKLLHEVGAGQWIDAATGEPYNVPEKAEIRPYKTPVSSPANIALDRFLQENPNATSKQISDFIQSQRVARSGQAAAVRKFMEENPNATADDIVRFNAKQAREVATERVFGAGFEARAVNSMNTVADHLYLLRQAAVGLGNGDVQLINTIQNELRSQTGDTRPVTFAVARELAADEVARAVIGGVGSETTRTEVRNLINRAQSPKQLEAAIRESERFIGGRLDSLRRQYAKGDVEKLKTFNDEMLSERAKEALTMASGGTVTPADSGTIKYDAQGNRVQ